MCYKAIKKDTVHPGVLSHGLFEFQDAEVDMASHAHRINYQETKVTTISENHC